MPFDLTPTAILTLYTLVFLSQVYVGSIHYPRAMMARIRHIISHFPPGDYPRLYPDAPASMPAQLYSDRLMRGTRIFLIVNYLIAAAGIGLITVMLTSSYEPSVKGGAEIFVMIYFFMQSAPIVYAAIREYSTHKRMRELFDEPKRSADLRPRRLFDYISPAGPSAAIAMYLIWLAFFLSVTPEGSSATSIERIATILLITGMNVAYAVIIAGHISGKKINPYQSAAEREQVTRTTVRILTISSFMASFFLTMTQAADHFAFEVFDPVMVSVFMQMCLIFGVGETFRSIRVDQINFDVYKEGGIGKQT